MLTPPAIGDSRLSFWLRVREFAVPPSMIETATARRLAGDWAGACAAAGFDVDIPLRSVARSHHPELAARIRADLRCLAPDLLRWHMPRIAPDGLLRPGLTLTLARYDASGLDGVSPVHLVARTPPAWADAGQRISLTLWDGSGADYGADAGRHPHPRPSRRFRFDLHRHLWDAGRAGELRVRSGADGPAAGRHPAVPTGAVPDGYSCAVGRWAAEARILLRAEGLPAGPVLVRCGGRHRLVLDVRDDAAASGSGSGWGVVPEPGDSAAGSPLLPEVGDSTSALPLLPEVAASASALPVLPEVAASASALPVLPDAATWVPPDLELVRAGAIDVDRLHPSVASALVPGHVPAGPSALAEPAGQPRPVECRGARHRIGLVDGVLSPLDHAPDEIRREELLVALGGTPLPCLQAIDEAHRHPDCLTGVRERLVHGDIAGALAVVEGLLGPGALLRDGALRDALEAAARQRITYGLYRADLIGPGRFRPEDVRRPRVGRSRPRHGTHR
ncbi:hypothetical protein OG342_04465 [Streptomyces bobili]|uniref:hypothetical protein n=1 Tax=Streptomyces bobili TaxID=67280 RepID=UPI00224CDF91|nr:hypothetical protein [Streptomyces bobili]MCX5522122.1 hypothetical protein [Streptomyces bobili]